STTTEKPNSQRYRMDSAGFRDRRSPNTPAARLTRPSSVKRPNSHVTVSTPVQLLVCPEVGPPLRFEVEEGGNRVGQRDPVAQQALAGLEQRPPDRALQLGQGAPAHRGDLAGVDRRRVRHRGRAEGGEDVALPADDLAAGSAKPGIDPEHVAVQPRLEPGFLVAFPEGALIGRLAGLYTAAGRPER